MGFRARVVVRDKVGKAFKIREKQFVETLSKSDLERIARQCELIIKETIIRKSKNPTGYLASFFTAQPIPNGWGVGDVNELDSQAPYWNHVDKGSLGIGANWEHTLPKGRWFGGVWIVDDSGYFAKPKTPIPGKHYIAETLAQMEVLIPIILRT